MIGHTGITSLIWAALAASACVVPPAEPPRAPPPQAQVAQEPPEGEGEGEGEGETEPEPEPGSFYGPEEALADALSGPLIHIGTGPWHGIAQFHACAYRNKRVIVVDIYCTQKEKRVFSLHIFSPARGRSRLYAEAEDPITTIRRDAYVMWAVEAEPPPQPDRVDPPLSLDMSFKQLRDYTEQRYKLRLDACYRTRRSAGCLREAKQRSGEWDDVSQDFWNEPTDSWYQAMGLMRSLAKINGT